MDIISNKVKTGSIITANQYSSMDSTSYQINFISCFEIRPLAHNVVTLSVITFDNDCLVDIDFCKQFNLIPDGINTMEKTP